ncbi:hypothetical protein [Streptomyces sp. NRRL S-350]|uniref:hypothetical protein n=1 Tax=Streptomyces sp. NRRL S-350 TaxID=1463902 RepID=UPI0004BFDC20|nr:hypothetical protein [Streptomyces sp. NRRL S-350]
MSTVRRVIGPAAVALVAVFGLLVLCQSASAFLRQERCPRAVVAEAKLAEEAVAPKSAPGLCWVRPRDVEVPDRRPESTAAIADDAPATAAPSPVGVTDPPYGTSRRSRAAVLQVFRC